MVVKLNYFFSHVFIFVLIKRHCFSLVVTSRDIDHQLFDAENCSYVLWGEKDSEARESSRPRGDHVCCCKSKKDEYNFVFSQDK